MVVGDLTGESFRLTLDCWGRFGETLARYDGVEVRVFGGIPGEDVVAEVIKRRREYIAAKVVEVLSPSPHRIAAPCPYFGPCTGCQWQHIDYEYQLQTKRQMVLDALGQAGGFDEATVSSTVAAPEQYEYRNHARFTSRRDGTLGFVNRESRRFVTIPKCLLMQPWINEALEQLQGRCAETTQLSIRYGTNTGDFLIQPTLKSQEVPLPTGQTHYLESLGGRNFRIASPSFFQVNIRQAARMVDLVRDGLQLTGQELLIDAYAGVGTFAISLAPYASKIIAIEESASAVQDAVINAKGLDSIQFLQGKTEEVLSKIEDKPHGVVLDPPRAGCQRAALDAVVRLAPKRVVYVSCDPGTLARDLKVLCQGPLRLEHVQPLDMFPQTHHVECIATLSYSGPAPSTGTSYEPQGSAREAGLVLASASPRRRELLSCLGSEFRVVPSSVSEDKLAHESPLAMVERLAGSKAKSVAQRLPGCLVIGADSVVVADGRALGKPADAAEAWDMLKNLRGREHQVVTGVAVVGAGGQPVRIASHVSQVTMRNYSDEEIAAYIASGEPSDKAGAYAIQDKSFHPAASFEGCYTNVMGLPLCTLVDMLKDSGFGFDTSARAQVPEECYQCPLKGPY